MRHVLRRHEIAEATRARLHCEAVYCGIAPMFAGESGLPFYRGFLDRMARVGLPNENENTTDTSIFDAIAARAGDKPNAAILNDPETQRRIAAIQRGEKPA